MTQSTSRFGGMTATPIQTASLAFGVVFLLVGILGFVPGITTNSGDLMVAGHESGAMLFGLFQVSILHNLVHLAFGVAGLVCARAAGTSRAFLVWVGAVYAVLWIYGLVVPHDSTANFVPLNTADNWLHFVLAAAMIGLGIVLSRNRARSTTHANLA